MSSNGEMKISLNDMTFSTSVRLPKSMRGRKWATDILVLQVLQELQFAICSLGEDWRAEGLHDLLDGDILAGQLVSGRAVEGVSWSKIIRRTSGRPKRLSVPDEAKSSHANGLEV